ncbi:MAG: hypothetical protein LUH54_05560 [Firmicutes bacterium]|nr:hypothetical protein [Bacillota bacterium]
MKNRCVATCSFEDSSGDTKIYYPTNYDVITTGEEWSEISENVGLKYKSSFFDENALVVVQIQGCGTTSIEGMLCLVAEESTLTPVIQINYVKDSAQSEDLVYWYVITEVSKADIEDCELGELEVEWNIIEAE